MTLGFLSGSKNFCKLLCFLWSYCFARIRLDPLGGQVLHHDCIFVIVSRFTALIEDIVICCYQVTKIFCTRHGSANASSARGPFNFGSLADLTFLVFWEVNTKTILPSCHFHRTLRIWVMRNVCGCWYLCDFVVLCEVLLPFGKIFAAVFSGFYAPTFEICWIQWSRWLQRKRRRGGASCWNSMIVQGPPEERSLASIFLPIFGQMWRLTAGPHLRKSVLFEEFSDDRTAGVFSTYRTVTKRWRWFLCFFLRLYFSIGRYTRYGVPGSPKGIRFAQAQALLLSVCIDQSRSRLLAVLALSKRVPALPRLRQESRPYLFRPPCFLC